MKVKTPERGGVCKSTQGRDTGRAYIIIDVRGEFAYVADGKTRSVNSPKKKNVKHLYLYPERCEDIAAKLVGGKAVYDNEVAYALAHTANGAAKKSEDDLCQKAT